MKRPCTNEAVLCDISQVLESVAEGFGYRAWSIIDARAGTITLHVEYPPILSDSLSYNATKGADS